MNAYRNVATPAQARAAVSLAIAHAPHTRCMRSSAEICAQDAAAFLAEERFGFAHEWALESLAYSVGIRHPDYVRVQRESRAAG